MFQYLMSQHVVESVWVMKLLSRHSDSELYIMIYQYKKIRYLNLLLHMAPNDARLLSAYNIKCTYLLNAYDAKMHQG